VGEMRLTEKVKISFRTKAGEMIFVDATKITTKPVKVRIRDFLRKSPRKPTQGIRE